MIVCILKLIADLLRRIPLLNNNYYKFGSSKMDMVSVPPFDEFFLNAHIFAKFSRRLFTFQILKKSWIFRDTSERRDVGHVVFYNNCAIFFIADRVHYDVVALFPAPDICFHRRTPPDVGIQHDNLVPCGSPPHRHPRTCW
jgi:hypothetical protein